MQAMTKDEQLDLGRILMINAFVKFNLIPPVGSAEWKSDKYRYKCMYMYLLPAEHINEVSEKRIMALLGTASAAKTPHAKLNLYRELSGVTGYSLMQLACPILHKFTTLRGLCSYTLFNFPDPRQNDAVHLVPEIEEWSEFYDKLPKYYLWDSHNYEPPWTTSVLAAALCIDLQRVLDDPARLSCLYALAVVLEREEIIARLDQLNITGHNMPENTKKIFVQFLSDKKVEQALVETPHYL